MGLLNNMMEKYTLHKDVPLSILVDGHEFHLPNERVFEVDSTEVDEIIEVNGSFRSKINDRLLHHNTPSTVSSKRVHKSLDELYSIEWKDTTSWDLHYGYRNLCTIEIDNYTLRIEYEETNYNEFKLIHNYTFTILLGETEISKMGGICSEIPNSKNNRKYCLEMFLREVNWIQLISQNEQQ